MKQKYEKPAFLAESFSLSQTVAAGCGALVMESANQGSYITCSWSTGMDRYDQSGSYVKEGDGIIDTLFSSMSICNIIAKSDADTIIYGVCYNNPDSNMKLFAS